MPTPIELFKSFAYGTSDYIQRHNSNYGIIEQFLNQFNEILFEQSGGQVMVPLGLREIFDRCGIIGGGSYDFDAGGGFGPDIIITSGAFWDPTSGTFCSRTNPTTLSLVGKANGFYYIKLDAAGIPSITDVQDNMCCRRFQVFSETLVVGSYVLAPNVSILFDGDEYQAMLDTDLKHESNGAIVTPATVGKRLEIMEGVWGNLLNYFVGDPRFFKEFSEVWNITGGLILTEAGITEVAGAAFNVSAHHDCTGLVELNPATATIGLTIGTEWTEGYIPLYRLTFPSAGSSWRVSLVEDFRTCYGGIGGGGGGGGHTQNTDLGTNSDTFTTGLGATGSPAGRAGLEVENGDDPNAAVKFNRDTGHWEYTEDGGQSWQRLGEFTATQGDQRFSKFVPVANPPKVLEELLRGPSADFEDLDLTSFIEALQLPQGMVTAVMLRVFFWDTEPDTEESNVVLRQGGSGGIPLLAGAVWNNPLDPATIIVPVDAGQVCQYFITSSATGANIRVFLAGWFEDVAGVGSKERNLVFGNLAIPPAPPATVHEISGFMNRGLCHYFKIEETGQEGIGPYTCTLYDRHPNSIGAQVLYDLVNINPDTPFEDSLPFWVSDFNKAQKLYAEITHADPYKTGTFTVTMRCEQFE